MTRGTPLSVIRLLNVFRGMQNNAPSRRVTYVNHLMRFFALTFGLVHPHIGFRD